MEIYKKGGKIVKDKVYIYSIVSFLMLLIPTAKEGCNTDFEFYILMLLTILSSIVAAIGFIKIIRKWKNSKKAINILLIIINILLMISGVFWFLAYLTMGAHDALENTIIWNFIRVYRKIIPQFIK
jgi:hypothetical protein